MAGNSETKNLKFLSPTAGSLRHTCFEHLLDPLLSCLPIFLTLFPVSPPPCCPLLNLKSQLPFRSLDVHLVLLLHPLGLHLLASNFVLLQINKISHRVWKSLDSLDIIVCKEPIRMKLNHIYRPFFRLKIIKCNIGNFNRCTEIRCLGCGPILTNRRWTRTNAYFLRRAGALPSVSNVGALPSVSNVAISGSADQTQSLRPSGSLTDRVERVRPLDSQSEEGSVRQRVRPLVDTLGEENAHIGTTTATGVLNNQAQLTPQPVPYFGIFVHCLTNHQGQSLTFTSEWKSQGNRRKIVTKIGRSPWIVEVVELLHPQGNQIRLWTLPTTASFERNCLKFLKILQRPIGFIYINAWYELDKIYIEIPLAFGMPTRLVPWKLRETNGSLLKHIFRTIPVFVLSIPLPHENRSWQKILWTISKTFINQSSRNTRPSFSKLWKHWYPH